MRDLSKSVWAEWRRSDRRETSAKRTARWFVHARLQEIPLCAFIFQTTESCDGAVQRRAWLIFIRLDHLKIRSQYWKHQLYQLRMLQNLYWCAVESPQFLKKFGSFQVISRRLIFDNLWSATTANEEMSRLYMMRIAQVTSQFKGDDRTHTVTEKSER